MALDSPITPSASPRLRIGFAKPSQEQIVLLITIALLIVFSFTLNGFATVANMLVLLRSISILGILGLGMGMIVISRGIDLSEVAIMAGAWCDRADRRSSMVCRSCGPWRWRSPSASPSASSTASWSPLSKRPALFVTLAATFVIYGVAFWIAPA